MKVWIVGYEHRVLKVFSSRFKAQLYLSMREDQDLDDDYTWIYEEEVNEE